jgi:hypothetical protein
VKLLKGALLSDTQIQATLHELSTKCQIFGSGCLKRGRKDEGEYYLRLPEKLRGELH